jgi:ankyrin repeat protein
MKTTFPELKVTLLAVLLWTVVPRVHADLKEKPMSHEQEFLTAIEKGEVTKVLELLKSDRTLAQTKNADGVSAVLLAVYHRRPDIVEALLATGIELNVFEASATGRAERVKELVKGDAAQANAFAPDGFTPLGLAAFFGHKDVVEVLLANGARVNQAAKNAMRVMPLHSAVAARNRAIVRLLVENEADVNARQQMNFSSLHDAAANGDVEIAQLLISHGAAINAKTDGGKTPLALALKKNHARMADFLRRYGAVE